MLKKRILVAITSPIMVIAGMLAGIVILFETTSGPSPAAAAPELTITGSLTLPLGAGIDVWGTGSCAGRRGYDDIQAGTQVVVSAGAVLGLGKLSPGDLTENGCVFTFTLVGVPAGHSFYAVEVGRRGAVQYTEADVTRGLALTLS